MQNLDIDDESLLIGLSHEYLKAEEIKTRSRVDSIDKKLRTIRIFISSTFRDFHNERNLLVTKVFPRLRDWCGQHGLYLVECDLRWGIPTYVSREDTLITCFDEIERGRNECNDMNFFLGLLGERYGWIPGKDEITDYIKRRYNWIEDSSVTFMEFLHGMIRTLTPNGLIMMRTSNFIDKLPDNYRYDFIEKDSKIAHRLKLFKQFLINNFTEQGLLHFYEPQFDDVIYDKFIEQNRVSLRNLESFCEIVENYFKDCIKNNLLNIIDRECDTKNNDNFHALMVRGCGKHCTIKTKTYIELFKYLKAVRNPTSDQVNSIVILSGTAGIGKTTMLAYCARQLEREAGCTTFFHSISCTTSSQYNEEIIERLYRFLKGKAVKNKNTDNKVKALMSILANGVEESDNQIYYLVFDGLDELCVDNNLAWIPSFTHRNIVIVISTLFDTHPSSFYSKLKGSDRNLKEIIIEHMNTEELSHVVTDYLDNFGKKLDSEQLNALLSFPNAKNPLWLISACEELRIHGDYSSIMKLILSLPPDIIDLNKLIIKRLVIQDTTNVLRCFLMILIISRAGVWENVVRDLISSLMNFPEPISHSTWLEIVRQMKGFLLIESIPLPLIKFRHRVMKQSIECEIQLKKDLLCSLHTKMANFFKPKLESINNLFLPDYFYHLIKSNSRNEMISFMRSKPSWTLFKQKYARANILLSMRCTNQIQTHSHSSINNLVMCAFCTNQFGQLSIYCVNKNSCFYCGHVIHDATYNVTLTSCSFHGQSNEFVKKCCLCENVISSSQSDCVKVCQICKTMTFPNRCGIIVKEGDILYKQQMSYSQSFNLEHLI